MKTLISCEFNMNAVCVELKFSDGSMIAIDTIAAENEIYVVAKKRCFVNNCEKEA